jgi:hypothetical protein
LGLFGKRERKETLTSFGNTEEEAKENLNANLTVWENSNKMKDNVIEILSKEYSTRQENAISWISECVITFRS